MVIDKRQTALLTTVSLASKKKMVNFGPLTLEIMRLMFTHSKSPLRVLRMLINAFQFGPRDFATGGNFNPSFSNFPHNRTYGIGRSYARLCAKFLV